MKRLLIVESPAKAKTIGKYLGSEFVVKSSVGHIRDLPKKDGLSITISPADSKEGPWSFTPTYVISPDKKKVVDELKAATKAADEIFLAPDPDREGEAIAWHLKEVLSPIAGKKPFHRVTYNEITKSAVKAAIANPREIDQSRVDAQQARRILDRIVGFQVSPFLWRYLNYGRKLSAGRVQSVALRLVVEREREIRNFEPVTYWLMGVEAKKAGEDDKVSFAARLSRFDGAKPEIRSQQQSVTIMDDLDGSCLSVTNVVKTPKTRHALPPFTTSTLQQAASGALGFSPSRTMSMAQHLYEEGLITYMRTDSVNVAKEAQEKALDYIRVTFGADFAPEKPNYYKSKSGAQEAHEAIRPTDCTRDITSLGLESAAEKLYRLIWTRFVSSQMAEAQLSQTTVSIEPKKQDLRHSYLFTASTTEVVFEGFLKVAGTSLVKKSAKGKDAENEDEESDEVKSLPVLAIGNQLDVVRWISDRKETKPPARFSEAALVKALEENGVGRPSTYAQTIDLLINREYALRQARQLVPTQRGIDVNDWLVKKLPELFDVGYTADMEASLDRVEEGLSSGEAMLSDFYRKFLAWLDGAREPAPAVEKFVPLFHLLEDVKVWKDPVKRGKRTYSDELFVESVKKQSVESPDRLTTKQLVALARLCVAYREQIPGCELRLVDLGWGALMETERNAPALELVKWCFQTIDRIGGMEHNEFLNSLRHQVDRGRTLSTKQFAILAKSVGDNARGLEDCEQVRARLAAYVPSGFTSLEVDPAVPELLNMVKGIEHWKEPVKRGRRVFNDQEFVESLAKQWEVRRSLSQRQVMALRRVVISYKDQIPSFDASAVRLGLTADAVAKASEALLKRAERPNPEADARRDAGKAYRPRRKPRAS